MLEPQNLASASLAALLGVGRTEGKLKMMYVFQLIATEKSNTKRLQNWNNTGVDEEMKDDAEPSTGTPRRKSSWSISGESRRPRSCVPMNCLMYILDLRRNAS